MTKKSAKTTVLSKAIATKYLVDEDSVDLSKFMVIEDSAAEVLLEYNGVLSLDGLRNVEALFCKLSRSSPREKELRPKRTDPPGTITNSIGMKLVPIPAGTFMMGASDKEKIRKKVSVDDEARHEVTLTTGYYLGMTQVTQSQYKIVMGKNPSFFQGKKVLSRQFGFPCRVRIVEECSVFLQEAISYASGEGCRSRVSLTDRVRMGIRMSGRE